MKRLLALVGTGAIATGLALGCWAKAQDGGASGSAPPGNADPFGSAPPDNADPFGSAPPAAEGGSGPASFGFGGVGSGDAAPGFGAVPPGGAGNPGAGGGPPGLGGYPGMGGPSGGMTGGGGREYGSMTGGGGLMDGGSREGFGGFGGFSGPGPDAELELTIRSLIGSYAAAKDEQTKQDIVAKITDSVAKQFELRQESRERELKRLEEQIKRLRANQQKRNEQKDRIVSERVQQMVHDVDGLGWGTGPINVNFGSMPGVPGGNPSADPFGGGAGDFPSLPPGGGDRNQFNNSRNRGGMGPSPDSRIPGGRGSARGPENRGPDARGPENRGPDTRGPDKRPPGDASGERR